MSFAPAAAARSIDALDCADARCEPRLIASVPVSFNRATGIARNVSNAGLFIETDRLLPIGTRFELSLEFFDDLPDGPVVIRCEARVLRISDTADARGMAVTIRWLESARSNDRASRADWTAGY